MVKIERQAHKVHDLLAQFFINALSDPDNPPAGVIVREARDFLRDNNITVSSRAAGKAGKMVDLAGELEKRNARVVPFPVKQAE